MEKTASECQEICLAGTDDPWMKLHSNYSDFCADKTSPKCHEYCNPKAGGTEDTANALGDKAACSPKSRMNSIIGKYAKDAEDAAGGAAGGVLNAIITAIKTFLEGPFAKYLSYVCGILCLIIVGYFAVPPAVAWIGKKTVSSVVHMGDSTDSKSDINVGESDVGKVGGRFINNGKYNKYVIMLVFFIFIIYNENSIRK